MNKNFNYRVILGLAIFFIFFILYKTGSNFSSDINFSYAPVQESGRMKSIDSFAKNQLLRFYGKREIKLDNGNIQSAADWLISISDQNNLIDSQELFYITNPELAKNFDVDKIKDSRRYSYNDLKRGYQYLSSEVRLYSFLNSDQKINSIEKQIDNLNADIVHYQFLKANLLLFSNSIKVEDKDLKSVMNIADNQMISIAYFMSYHDKIFENILNPNLDFSIEFNREFNNIKNKCIDFVMNDTDINKAISIQQNRIKEREKFIQKRREFNQIEELEFGNRAVYTANNFNIIPMKNDEESLYSPYIILRSYFLSDEAYLGNMKSELLFSYNDIINNDDKESLKNIFSIHDSDVKRLKYETNLNNSFVFYYSQILCLFSFLLIVVSWMLDSFKNIKLANIFRQSALIFMITSFCLLAFGIIVRMYVMNRPPVTTLYESILFVTFIMMLISLIVEFIRKDTLGLFIGSIGGAVLHFVASKYALDGDTFGVLVAVLDSNFWLSTHVTTITFGYGVSLVTGIMAHIYLLQACINPNNKDRLKIIFNNLYVLTFVALFFTMFGTILGGIWADQSWVDFGDGIQRKMEHF